MKFSIWYQGKLKSNGDARHKQEVRAKLEPQFREIWRRHGNPGLFSLSVAADRLPDPTTDRDAWDLAIQANPEWLDEKLVRIRGDVTFVPLLQGFPSFDPPHVVPVRLSITILRTGAPGGIIDGGDIDNRLKTLFDALHPPSPDLTNSFSSDGAVQFCLLDDDRQIAAVEVDTRQLWVAENDSGVVVLIEVTAEGAAPSATGPVIGSRAAIS